MAQGKILRDTSNGEGIISLNGEQKIFTLEEHWKSEDPPKIGAVVDVTLNEQGEVESVVLVDAKELAKQQAQEALEKMNAKGKILAGNLSEKGKVLTAQGQGVASVFWGKVHKPMLFAIIGFVFISIFMRDFVILSEIRYDYWGRIYYKKSNDHYGLYDILQWYGWSLFFWIAVISPVIKTFIDSSKAYLLYLLPFIMTLLVCMYVYNGSLSSSVRFGLSTWILLALSSYLAVIGINRYKK